MSKINLKNNEITKVIVIKEIDYGPIKDVEEGFGKVPSIFKKIDGKCVIPIGATFFYGYSHNGYIMYCDDGSLIHVDDLNEFVEEA